MRTRESAGSDLHVYAVPRRRPQRGAVRLHSPQRPTSAEDSVLMIPVPAGAYKWLEETDSMEVAVTVGNSDRARRLPAHESRG